MSDTSETLNRELTIELRDVVREYRVGGQTVRALDGISLRLTGGQFVSIVGPSGAGKSTLLHLLGALDSPDSGSIIDGEEIAGGGINIAIVPLFSTNSGNNSGGGINIAILPPFATNVGNCTDGNCINLFGFQLLGG